jgi:hypothetical protein
MRLVLAGKKPVKYVQGNEIKAGKEKNAYGLVHYVVPAVDLFPVGCCVHGRRHIHCDQPYDHKEQVDPQRYPKHASKTVSLPDAK